MQLGRVRWSQSVASPAAGKPVSRIPSAGRNTVVVKFPALGRRRDVSRFCSTEPVAEEVEQTQPVEGEDGVETVVEEVGSPEAVAEFGGVEETSENGDEDVGYYSMAAPVMMDSGQLCDMELDAVLQKELRENGFRSTRRTRIICTIGPATESPEMLEKLARNGMNVARLNMCHASPEWHRNVINRIRHMNREKGYSVAVMVDTEGSEVHISSLFKPQKLEVDDEVTFTVRKPPYDDGVFGVSYDAFIYDVEVGDQVIVDGGMVLLEVIDKAGPDVHCCCIDPGLILSRANLTFKRAGELIRGQNANLSVVTAKDWQDIDFAIDNMVDFIAISFVKSADVIQNLSHYIQRKSGQYIEIIAKIESMDSLPNLDAIARASDGLMVARGDLGAQIALDEVPSVQKEIVIKGRELGKPVIVASHLLQSMIDNPIPTRAEVADVADVVRQRADALMLCSESAAGNFPDKALEVLRSVSTQVEEWCRQEQFGSINLPSIAASDDGQVSEELCASAAMMANNLKASAIFVYTRRGFMANFLSRLRPECPIFAFTDREPVRRRMNLRWGVMPFRMSFDGSPEDNITRTFRFLKVRNMVDSGDLVVVVSDIRPDPQEVVRSVQIRHVP